MSILRKILYPALFLVFVLLTQSIFVVKETERAVKLRFGEIVEYDVEPGLHFKVPVVNTVRKPLLWILLLNGELVMLLNITQPLEVMKKD